MLIIMCLQKYMKKETINLKRSIIGIWEDLYKGKKRLKLCNYIINSKIKETFKGKMILNCHWKRNVFKW